MNFIWWRIQVDWIARVSLSNYSPLHFPIVLFKSSLLAFPKFSSTYLLGFCSNGLLLCLGFTKYLDLENKQQFKAMIVQCQRECKVCKCVDALVLICICIYICILCGKQSSQETSDKTMVGDWLWQATNETFVFVFHICVFLCLYLFRILCGKQAGGKTMVDDGL